MATASVERQLLDSLKGDVAIERSLRLSPDGEEGETFLLLGSPSQLIANTSVIMAIWQMIRSSELSKVVGYPYEQYVTTHPAPIGIQFNWRLVKSKPWEPQGLAERLNLNRKTLPRPQLYVQNIDAETLTWQKLWDAAGGENGYLWGRFYAHTKMTNLSFQSASYWQLTVFGGSPEEARKRLRKMAALSKDSIGTVTVGEQVQDEGRRKTDRQFRKPTVRIYPAWFFVNNYELVKAAMQQTGVDNEPVDYEKSLGRSTALGKQFKMVDAFYLNKAQPSRDDLERLRAVLRSPRAAAMGESTPT